MRLATKLSLAVFACFALGVCTAGVLIIHREFEFADHEITQHGRLLGRVIASSVEETWAREGAAAVGELLAEIDKHDRIVHVRWAAIDALPGAADHSPLIVGDVRERLLAGKIVDHINRRGDDTLYTLVPIVHDGKVARVVEVAESLVARDRHIRMLLLSIVGALLGALLISGAAVFAAGRVLVGRPITALVAKARRVARWDLSTPVEVAGRDELHDLAVELNIMARGLARERSRAEQEEQIRRETEAQLRHAERLATVGKLASGVAHEMGTPLNVISESARRIGEGDRDVPRHVETITRQAARITEIVKSLLRFARRQPVARRRIDLREVVHRALPMLESVGGRKPVAITERCEVGEAPVEGDEEQLEQVLTNLVVNAVQAMPGGGRVTVGLDRARRAPPDNGAPLRDVVRLSVEDEGEGIAPEAVAHIFDPFFTTKEVGEGTGLGLSICFGIVKDHGGWIEVDSTPGLGSQFAVYLPAAKGQGGHEREVRGEEEAHGDV